MDLTKLGSLADAIKKKVAYATLESGDEVFEPMIRKDFPEVWLWNSETEEGCVVHSWIQFYLISLLFSD